MEPCGTQQSTRCVYYCIFGIFYINLYSKTIFTVILNNQTTSLTYNVNHWEDVWSDQNNVYKQTYPHYNNY